MSFVIKTEEDIYNQLIEQIRDGIVYVVNEEINIDKQ